MSTHKIYSNLLQQNCYVRDITRLCDLKTDYPVKQYVSCDEVVTDKGVEIKDSILDYNITPATVASYADSCDYKTDPLSNISKSSGSTVDLRSIQDFSKLSSQEQLSLYQQLSKKIASGSSGSSQQNIIDNKDSEVKNNE